MWISGVVTHLFWFTWFMEGLHKQAGEVRHQDEAISIEVLHAVEIILEREWSQATQLSHGVVVHVSLDYLELLCPQPK
jgi:hypothetical protein